jgi:phage shock protein PspC (stress-responsive transcriptional regulator)
MQEIKGRRLERGRSRVAGGVCSGLAGYFSVDPLFVRVVLVLLMLASGAGVVLYLILWLFMPEEGEPPRDGDVLGAGIRSVEADLRRIFGDSRSSIAVASPRPPAAHVEGGGLWLVALLIAVGAVVLATSAGLLGWWNWVVTWPVLVIALGALVLARRLS